jgi:hypothetical protein
LIEEVAIRVPSGKNATEVVVKEAADGYEVCGE